MLSYSFQNLFTPLNYGSDNAIAFIDNDYKEKLWAPPNW